MGKNKDIKIYHNNRCSKSRDALALLMSKTSNFKIVDYIKNPIKFEELESILIKLKLKPIELVRINENIWKEKYKNKQLSDKEIMKAMIENPKLIERPIIVTNKKAIIGRPAENVLYFF